MVRLTTCKRLHEHLSVRLHENLCAPKRKLARVQIHAIVVKLSSAWQYIYVFCAIRHYAEPIFFM
jgi:hypothetical protein